MKQKKNLFRALLLAIGIALAGCSDSDDNPVADTLKLDSYTLSFGFDDVNNPQTVAVTTNATGYDTKIDYGDKDDDGWLDIKRSAQKFEVTVKSDNESGKERKAVIIVTAGNAAEERVAVTQGYEAIPGEDTLTIEPEELAGNGLVFEWDETRKDKELKVTTNAGGGPKAELKNPDDRTWLDLELKKGAEEGTNTLLVAVKDKNASGNDYAGTIIIKAGNATPVEVNVTQKCYVETDFTITLPNGEASDETTFTANKDLTKTITVTTNGTGLKATKKTGAGWITKAAFEGKILTVEVEENKAKQSRSEELVITNEEGGEAVLKVIQQEKPDVDITGTWTWTSISSNSAHAWYEGYEGLEDIVCEVTVAPVMDGGSASEDGNTHKYSVAGAKGKGFKLSFLYDYEEINCRLFITMEEKDGDVIIKVVDDLSFEHNATSYYSSKSLQTDGFTAEVFTGGEFVCRYKDEGGTETITFPQEWISTAEDFPANPELVGLSFIPAYGYHYKQKMGPWENTIPIDHHREAKLTRTK